MHTSNRYRSATTCRATSPRARRGVRLTRAENQPPVAARPGSGAEIIDVDGTRAEGSRWGRPRHADPATGTPARSSPSRRAASASSSATRCHGCQLTSGSRSRAMPAAEQISADDQPSVRRSFITLRAGSADVSPDQAGQPEEHVVLGRQQPPGARPRRRSRAAGSRAGSAGRVRRSAAPRCGRSGHGRSPHAAKPPKLGQVGLAALIRPGDRGAERLVVGVEQHPGVTLGYHAYARHGPGIDAVGCHDLPDRVHHARAASRPGRSPPSPSLG